MPTDTRSLDPHQDAVYRWEDEWPAWNRNHVSLRVCRKAIRAACKWYKVEPPTVTQHDGRGLAFSWPKQHRISMQGGEHARIGGKNIATALHEAAHHIAYAIYGERLQDHGRTWLGIYLNLLERAGIAPRVALEASARAHGLKWRKIY